MPPPKKNCTTCRYRKDGCCSVSLLQNTVSANEAGVFLEVTDNGCVVSRQKIDRCASFKTMVKEA